MIKPTELLILKYDDLNIDIDRFFQDLGKSKPLRKLFFSNPSLLLRTKFESVAGIGSIPQSDDQANKVLFSVLSNKAFMAFLKDFQARKSLALDSFMADPKDKEAISALDEKTIRLEFAEAILKFGDKELVANLLTRGRTGPLGGPYGWWLIVVAVVIIVVVAAVHAVVELGTSGDSVLAKNRRLNLSASELKKMSKQLIAAANSARELGELG